MTIAELYNQVAQMGFEDSLEDDDRFLYAANRALLQVNKIRPAIGYYLINHRTLENKVREKTFVPVPKKQDITFEAMDAKSYSFQADGTGSCYIELFDADTESWDIVGSVELASSGEFVQYKDFIKDGNDFVSGLVRLRFSGDYFFQVRNVALYDQILSDSQDDIPVFENYTRYDLAELCSDFMSFSSPPIVEAQGNTILNSGYEIEGNSVLLLPYGKNGVFKVIYEKRPNKIENENTITENDTEIDLDEELCSLMPNLVASYIWLEDEPELSQYYMNLYKEREQTIKDQTVSNKPVEYKDVYGW